MPMHAALKKTFDVLAATANPAAVDLLIVALGMADEGIRTQSLTSLLKKPAARGHLEVIRRLPELTGDMRALLEKHAGPMGRAVRQALTQNDAELRGNALEIARWLQDVSQIPLLVHLLEDSGIQERGMTGAVLLDLVNRLYEQMRRSPVAGETQRLREQSLAALEIACVRFDAHQAVEIVEGAIILCGADGPLLRKIFHETSQLCRDCAAETLFRSIHPGVMSVIVDSMAQNFPMREVIAAFEGRDDPEFIAHLLSSWPHKLTANQQKNFREISTILWLDAERLCLETISPGLHRQLIAFLLHTGVPLDRKLDVLEWMVRFGSPEGRQAATDVLVDLEDNDHKVTEVILEGLESDAPDVQAWATHQLRSRHVPDAFRLLIERLDSPLPEVRAAAQAELGDFNILRVLEMYEQLDRTMCEAIGRLVLKIDPQTPIRLRHEMLHAIRRKRIRAARGALALRLHHDVADALHEMTLDSDNLVRRTAAEVLGQVGTPAAMARLRELLRDVSPRVREVSAAALRDLEHLTTEVDGPMQEDRPGAARPAMAGGAGN